MTVDKTLEHLKYGLSVKLDEIASLCYIHPYTNPQLNIDVTNRAIQKSSWSSKIIQFCQSFSQPALNHTSTLWLGLIPKQKIHPFHWVLTHISFLCMQ